MYELKANDSAVQSYNQSVAPYTPLIYLLTACSQGDSHY